MVLGSYATDLLMLFALSWAGALPVSVAWAATATGAGWAAFIYLVHVSKWNKHFKDRSVVLAEMLMHTAILMGFSLWAPQIGVMLLAILFIVFSFGAMFLSVGQAVICAIAIAISLTFVMSQVGDRMLLPTANLAQRAVCGLWFSLILIRTALLGMHGASLRKTLARRNAELAATFEKLEHLASRDELTGALNRRSLMRLIEEESQRMGRSGAPFAVALLDIDHFKRVNDRYGHPIGDEVLRHFTAQAALHMRSVDRMGRYGGEEFMLLLTDVDNIDDAISATERVRQGIALHDWRPLAKGLTVTVSAGVAISEPGESVSELLTRTDQALYRAKNEGRNRVCLADARSLDEPVMP